MRYNVKLFVSGVLCVIAFQQQGCNDTSSSSNDGRTNSQRDGAISLVGNPPSIAHAIAPVEDLNLEPAIQTKQKLEVAPVLPKRRQPPALRDVVKEQPVDEEHALYNLEGKIIGITFEAWNEGRQASEQFENRRLKDQPVDVSDGEEMDQPPITTDPESVQNESPQSATDPEPVQKESPQSATDPEPVEKDSNAVDDELDASDDSESKVKRRDIVDRVKRNDTYEEDYLLDHLKKQSLILGRPYSWITEIAGRLSLVSPKTSSEELWNSFGGPERIKMVNQQLETSYMYESITPLLMLASEFALLPTKIGMTQFNIDSRDIQDMCKIVMQAEGKFKTGLEQSMADRRYKRSNRWGHEYTYEFVYKTDQNKSVFFKHPLANIPIICSVTNDVVRGAILNHRIGRHIHSSVLTQHGDYCLNFNSICFEINPALTKIRDESVERLLYGVTRVSYVGESAGGPGPVRDWFGKMIEKVFDPTNEFFVLPDNDKEELVYRINVESAMDMNFIDYWHAIGRLFAMSLIDGVPLGIVMNRGIYQILLGKTDKWDQNDLLEDHIGLYNSWKSLAKYDGDISLLTVSAKSLDNKRNFLLKKNNDIIESSLTTSIDEEMDLTNDNVDEWSKWAINDHMYENAKNAYIAIVDGFYELLPRNIFDGLANADHLRDMLRGELCAKKIIAAMDYVEFTNDSEQIKRLHEILLEADETFLSNFLNFTTGLRALPFGFTQSRSITIKQNELPKDKLPLSHTCSFTIEFPAYETKDDLKRKLSQAVVSGDMYKG